MSDLSFYLFRITIHEKPIFDLIDKLKSKQELLKKMIESHPKILLGNHVTWNLGNVTNLDNSLMYFRLGRVSKRSISNLDNEGNFVDQNIDVAQYSHCLIDIGRQLLAMSYNANLSASIQSQGKSIEKLLNHNLKEYVNFDNIEIRPVPDPREFIKQIQTAHQVSRFWIKVRRPNLFDVDKDFVQPLSELNNELASKEVKVEVSGEDLDKEKIEKISTNTALEGSKGGATIKEEKKSSNIFIHLGKNLMKFKIKFDNLEESKDKILKQMNYLYDLLSDNK